MSFMSEQSTSTGQLLDFVFSDNILACVTLEKGSNQYFEPPFKLSALHPRHSYPPVILSSCFLSLKLYSAN